MRNRAILLAWGTKVGVIQKIRRAYTLRSITAPSQGVKSIENYIRRAEDKNGSVPHFGKLLGTSTMTSPLAALMDQ